MPKERDPSESSSCNRKVWCRAVAAVVKYMVAARSSIEVGIVAETAVEVGSGALRYCTAIQQAANLRQYGVQGLRSGIQYQ